MLKKNINIEAKAHYLENKADLKSPPNPHNFVISQPAKIDTNDFSTSYREQFYTIPLIFYIYSRNRHRCEINSKIYINQTLKSLNALLETDKYRSGLMGLEVRLEFLNLPGTLYHQYTSHAIIIPLLVLPIVVPITFTKNEFYYREAQFAMRYLVLDSTTKTKLKEGIIEDSFPARHYIKKRADNRKEYLRGFIASYDTRIADACEKIATTLLNELTIKEKP